MPAQEPSSDLARIYQIKITLQGTRPAIWRRVLVPADATLTGLHRIVQAAMGWEDYHLWRFEIDDVRAMADEVLRHTLAENPDATLDDLNAALEKAAAPSGSMRRSRWRSSSPRPCSTTPASSSTSWPSAEPRRRRPRATCRAPSSTRSARACGARRAVTPRARGAGVRRGRRSASLPPARRWPARASASSFPLVTAV